MHMYVWSRKPSFIAVAHAESVEQARRLILDHPELGASGDGSCAERDKARKEIRENAPAFWYGPCGEFALTDSAEQAELGAAYERQGRLLRNLRAELAQVRTALDLGRAEVAGLQKRNERLRNFIAELQRGIAEACAIRGAAQAQSTKDLEAKRVAEANAGRLKNALCLIYNKWENGVTCYEDVEELVGVLGNAFQLSEAEENEILFALEMVGVETALNPSTEQRAAIEAASKAECPNCANPPHEGPCKRKSNVCTCTPEQIASGRIDGPSAAKSAAGGMGDCPVCFKPRPAE